MRFPIPLWGVAVAGSTLATFPHAAAGTVLQGQSEPPRSDSLKILEEAQDAQELFERVRRSHLPAVWGDSGGSCDEIVIRMCLTHDDGSWEPTPEPAEIQEARTELLGLLEALAVKLPGDEWILGQRLRYLAESGLWDEALGLSRGCVPAGSWWCHAVLGYALHGKGDAASAEEAFRRALAAMPAELAQEWSDLEVLLDLDGWSLLDGASEEERARLTRFLWALADPLFLVPGNDRATEHFSRQVEARIRSQGRSTYAMSWGKDMAELLLRYGREVGWERARPGPGQTGPGTIIGHHHPDSREFIPSVRMLRQPWDIQPGEWKLEAEVPHASYAPAYAPSVEELDASAYRLRRGDSLLVIFVYGAEPHEDPDRDASSRAGDRERWESGVFLLTEDGVPAYEARSSGDSAGVLTLLVPLGRYLASVEALDRQGAWAARTRYGLGDPQPLVPGAVALSDLLLLASGEHEPSSLEETLPRLLARAHVPARGRLGVSWEVYGLRPVKEHLRYRLTVVRRDRSFLRRAGEWLRLFDREPPLFLAWEEQGPERPGPQFRALNLDLPDLDPGEYEVTLELSLPGRSAIIATRGFRVSG
jgi:hypothetical protein